MVEISDEAWRHPEGAVTIGAAACFALDQQVMELPLRRAADRTWIQDDHFLVAYEPGPLAVRISAFGDRGRVGPAALRVIRELVLGQVKLCHPEAVELHAAGVAIEGRVVLLVGPKAAGKTTTLLRLAEGGRSDMVANDRALVRPSGDGSWAAHGVPTLVNVRRATLDRFPHLFAVLPAVERVIDHTMAELAQMPTGGGSSAGSSWSNLADLPLSPAQLAAAIGARRVRGGPVAAIVALHIDEQEPAFQLGALHGTAARAVLDQNRFGAATEPRPATVFEAIVGPAPSPASRSALDALEQEVPILRLTVGRKFLSDRFVADAILGALA